MKRNVLRRSLSLVLALLVALGMTCTVFATHKENGEVTFDMPSSIYVGEIAMGFLDAEESNDKNGPVLNDVTLSDTQIANVIEKTSYGFDVKGLKPGTVTMTINYTYKDQPASIAAALTVKEVPKCFKSLKINGKKVNLTKNALGFNKKVKKAKSVKIKVKPAKGWKVKSVRALAAKSPKSAKGVTIKVSKATVTKGKKISFAKKYKVMLVVVKMQNKKTGEKLEYFVQFYRNKPIAS